MLNKVREIFYNNIGVHLDGLYWYNRYEDYYEENSRLRGELEAVLDELRAAEDSIESLQAQVALLSKEK